VGTWLNIATFPICLTVTIVGLVLSFIAYRKKGLRSGLRGAAWSLLPLAMWLTNAVGLVGHIGSAIVNFATAFVFSPKAWLGVILACLAILLFLISGGIPLFSGTRRRNKARRKRGRSGEEQAPAAISPAARQAPPPQGGDDLSDVEEILRRRGIK